MTFFSDDTEVKMARVEIEQEFPYRYCSTVYVPELVSGHHQAVYSKGPFSS